MAFATLEDETGKIDLVIFPKIYSAYQQYWVKDKVLIVEGKFEAKEEGLSLVVDKAEALESSTEKKYDFIIRIPQGTSSSVLMALNQILKQNPGEKKGILIFENGSGGQKKLELNFGVAYNSKLAAEIDSLLNS